MNRKIKFRAWDESRKEMITNFGRLEQSMPELLQNDEYGNIFCGHYEDNGDWIEPVLMQYTGLKDKNGKEIYEGDILGWEKFEGTKNQTRWIVQYNNERGFKNWSSSDNDEIVIGNIYENPELLSND